MFADRRCLSQVSGLDAAMARQRRRSCFPTSRTIRFHEKGNIDAKKLLVDSMISILLCHRSTPVLRILSKG